MNQTVLILFLTFPILTLWKCYSCTSLSLTSVGRILLFWPNTNINIFKKKIFNRIRIWIYSLNKCWIFEYSNILNIIILSYIFEYLKQFKLNLLILPNITFQQDTKSNLSVFYFVESNIWVLVLYYNELHGRWSWSINIHIIKVAGSSDRIYIFTSVLN